VTESVSGLVVAGLFVEFGGRLLDRPQEFAKQDTGENESGAESGTKAEALADQ
jgi:hypothetical protein